MQKRSKQYSAILHAVLLAFILFGFPDFLRPRPEPEPESISVDILPLSPISNVKPQEQAPEKPPEKKIEDEKKAEKQPTPEAKKEEKPKPVEKQPELKPEPIKPDPEPNPDVVKKPVEKPPEVKKQPPKETPKKEEKKDDFDAILKSMKDSAKSEKSDKPTEKKVETPNTNAAKSDRYNDALPLTMSEKDSIISQIQKCWNVPAGAKDDYNLIVTLRIDATEDGTVTMVKLVRDESRYQADSFFRAATDAAIRAVKRCSPLQGLPAEKYENWKEMELSFNPKDMLY